MANGAASVALAMRWLLGGLLLLPLAALSQDGLVNDVALVDPSGSALRAFHEALGRSDQTKVRVVVYGASHTAGDQFTGELRRRLQRTHGDGGPGWVMPASPFMFYDHSRVQIAARGWTGRKIRGRERQRDDYGYAGFAVDGRDASSNLIPDAPVQRAEVHALRQPGGGDMVMRAGGQEVIVRTGGRHAFLREELRGSIDRVSFRTRGGPVRVFGVALENDGGGVVVDALGVPGARVWDQERWREASLRAQLRGRMPHLIALAYGTNESTGRGTMVEYRRRLMTALQRWKRLAPDASCLLIGPGEWPRSTRRGYVPRPRTTQVIGVQREVAIAQGCAFFDTYAMMGGEGSMARWVSAGLGLGDHVHFTDGGYRRMGAALERAIRP